jgi:50S ribosomal subunit-associated GTPase HflX
MHGSPWLRLLRREVEALARAGHGDRSVSEQQARAELTRVNREIRRLRTELAGLEERRAKLGCDLGE